MAVPLVALTCDRDKPHYSPRDISNVAGEGTTLPPKQGHEREPGWPERTMFEERLAGSGPMRPAVAI